MTPSCYKEQKRESRRERGRAAYLRQTLDWHLYVYRCVASSWIGFGGGIMEKKGLCLAHSAKKHLSAHLKTIVDKNYFHKVTQRQSQE